MSDLFRPNHDRHTKGRIVATYDYRDAAGALLFQVVRFDPKGFRQRRPDGNGGWIWKLGRTPRVLFRLPELIAASPEAWVYIVEGEKDVDNLAAQGLIATTCPQGAGKWRKLSDDSVLERRHVAIIVDKDAAGRAHAEDLARRLHGRVGDLRVLELPGNGKDVSDWLEAGGTVQELEKLVASAPPYMPSDTPDHASLSAQRDRLPTVLAPGPHTDDVGAYAEVSNADFTSEILRQLPDDLFCMRARLVGRIVGRAGRRSFQISEIDATRLLIDRYIRVALWRQNPRTQSQVQIYKPSSRDHAALILAAIADSPGIRALCQITPYPVYLSDWSLAKRGWNAEGVYFDAPSDLEGLEPITDRHRIHAILSDLIVDFPFRTEADRANAVGMVLSPIIQPAISGNLPMHIVISSLERTGKTKLAAECMGIIFHGHPLSVMPLPPQEEEIDKRILAELVRDANFMVLDNVRRMIDSPALASLLTARTYTGRLLGRSEMTTLPNNLALLATGNNVSTSGEIAKRSIPIQLQPRDDHPEARCDFVHPDFEAHVRGARRSVLAALLGAVEVWKAARCPRHPDRPALGGFEQWSRVTGGVLSGIGFGEWRANERMWRRAADPRGEDLVTLVSLWFARYAFSPTTAKDLAELAGAGGLFPDCFARASDHAMIQAFVKKALTANVDRPVGEFIIRRDEFGSSARYHLDSASS